MNVSFVEPIWLACSGSELPLPPDWAEYANFSEITPVTRGDVPDFLEQLELNSIDPSEDVFIEVKCVFDKLGVQESIGPDFAELNCALRSVLDILDLAAPELREAESWWTCVSQSADSIAASRPVQISSNSLLFWLFTH